jgi:hypothetical protein
MHALHAEPPFAALVADAIALVLERPDAASAILQLLEPFEAPRLAGELARVARGKIPPRHMSAGLRQVLPRLVACARPPPPVREAVAW